MYFAVYVLYAFRPVFCGFFFCRSTSRNLLLAYPIANFVWPNIVVAENFLWKFSNHLNFYGIAKTVIWYNSSSSASSSADAVVAAVTAASLSSSKAEKKRLKAFLMPFGVVEKKRRKCGKEKKDEEDDDKEDRKWFLTNTEALLKEKFFTSIFSAFFFFVLAKQKKNLNQLGFHRCGKKKWILIKLSLFLVKEIGNHQIVSKAWKLNQNCGGLIAVVKFGLVLGILRLRPPCFILWRSCFVLSCHLLALSSLP